MQCIRRHRKDSGMGVLLLVRHGQASFGSSQYDELSALGVIQADLVARRLADGRAKVRTLVSGSLLRQRATAEAIAAAGGLSTHIDNRWDEYDHVGITGDRAPELIFDASDVGGAAERAGTALDEAVRRWIADEITHTESHREFVARCSAALQSLTANREITVVTTSGGVIADICASLLGLATDSWPVLSRVTVNCGITKIVVGRQGTSLVSFNDHAHLEADPALITYR